AEDGIRDDLVTGVQTCALPIWSLGGIGHLTITARVNAIKASLPNPDSASQSQVPSSFHGAIPAPIVEAALGLVRGRGGFLSVDEIGRASCRERWWSSVAEDGGE